MKPVLHRARQMNRMTPTFVYRLFDDEGVLLYVGVSQDVQRRLRQHAAVQPWWPQVHHYSTIKYQTRREAQRAEGSAIRDEKPQHNVAQRGPA